MIKRPNLRHLNILIADSDQYLSRAVQSALRAMGFGNVQHVSNAADAIKMIRTKPVSFIISEWDLKGASGIDMVRYLRRNPDSPNRGLPVIMLTGRGEITDVQTARDVGISEFVVKPFSAQALFVRLEQVIDNPRNFVVSGSYVGPERRRRGEPPDGVGDRRGTKSVIVTPSREALRRPAGDETVIFSPDFSLRHALGSNKPLSSIVTPETIKYAQKSVDALGSDALKWLHEDLAQMVKSCAALKVLYTPLMFDQLKASTLSLKARAGTFNYSMASDVARLLYLFLSVDFVISRPRHLLVVEKHLEVLTLVFEQNIKERQGLGIALYAELERLIAYHK